VRLVPVLVFDIMGKKRATWSEGWRENGGGKETEGEKALTRLGDGSVRKTEGEEKEGMEYM
jgi:hypothetical protein